MPLIPKKIVKKVALRYIAGPSLVDAVNVTKSLRKIGILSTIDVLGEFVTDANRARFETETSVSVVEAIQRNQLESYLSVKLTSLGLDIDQEFAFENIEHIVTVAQQAGVFVRMDMENTPYTTITLEFYKRLREKGLDNVGVVIQSYLRRSRQDVEELLAYKPSIRLCKGIYLESEADAFKDPDEVRRSYKDLFRLMVSNGARVHIATHDEELIADAEDYLKSHDVPKDRYEFQMLLGVREDRRRQLAKDGHSVRVYVPFGEDWYGYSTRRLKENPQVAGYIAKALLFGK
jgi:proline dehydrogenase